jgi:hypothetical protein
MSRLRELLDRAELDGWTRELALRVASIDPPDGRVMVCVRCGWAWVPVSSVCVNAKCRAFCAWGEEQDAPPTSWLPDRPRPVGMPEAEWRAAWRSG